MGKVGQEDKDPCKNDRCRRVQMPVLEGRGRHCKVGRKVADPLGIWKHMIPRGANNIEAKDEYLGGHEQHGHGPGDPKATQLRCGSANTIVANSIKELAGSVEHKDAGVDVVLPPFLLSRQEHLKVIRSLVGLEVIARRQPQKPSTFVDDLLVSNPRWDSVTGSAAKLCSRVRQMYLGCLLLSRLLAILASLLLLVILVIIVLP
mmetsp:Transcript_5376/g.12655  ORF Transcript_5376/g.12655 Transcript_5376/m.12655 type:complete len:204 (+) Transcript_5376:1799-2410(+)